MSDRMDGILNITSFIQHSGMPLLQKPVDDVMIHSLCNYEIEKKTRKHDDTCMRVRDMNEPGYISVSPS
jgi:hypothetical protein